jgi:1-acyl-sn-glycerol-3-phosphate acyltransferase
VGDRSGTEIPPPPGPLKYNFIRYGLRFFASCYLRVRVEGAERLPDEPFLLNFSHPNWVDPVIVVAFWPQRRWIMIFGPREETMYSGGRNRLIRWARMGVPFKPGGRDLLNTTRRALAVFKRGHILAVAGEGRLSDEEGAIVPLEEGPGYLALRAQVPIVPVAIIGTRWLRFGKRVTMRVGDALPTAGRRPDRETMAAVTAELTEAMEKLLEGVVGEPPPGRFGRWLTDVFNERPWLDEGESGKKEADPPEE